MEGKRHRDSSGEATKQMVSPEADLAFLQKIPLFAELSEEQIRKICSIVHKEAFDPGEVILQEGDVGDTMYVLQEGMVEVSKELVLRVGRRDFGQREKRMARLRGEDHTFFGEMAMLEREGRSATVTAVTRCSLFVIEREDFERVCSEDVLLGYRVVREMARGVSSRLRSTNRDVLKLTTALSLALKR